MRLIITGHRRKKLEDNGYDTKWIEESIEQILIKIRNLQSPLICYSGMADGIDLIFCNCCNLLKIPYIACVPFQEQEDYMLDSDKTTRRQILEKAKEIKNVRNSWMVEHCDEAIVVWDGNKGGTANVVQQLIERKINFHWVNPVGKIIWKCFEISKNEN